MQLKKTLRSRLSAVSARATGFKKSLGKIIKLFVRLSLLAAVGCIGYQAVQVYPALRDYGITISTPSTVNLYQESIFNEATQQSVAVTLDHLLSGSTFYKLNPTFLDHELATPGSVVTSCAYSIDASGGMTVTVRGVEPLFVVNEQLVLGSNQQLHARDLFEQYPLETLHQVTVSDEYCGKVIDNQVYEFLQKVPLERFKNYTFKYKDRHYVQVRPQDVDKKYYIKADEQSFFDDKKIVSVSELYEQLRGQALTRKGKEKLWVFDIRFDKRIFIRSGREGEGDE